MQLTDAIKKYKFENTTTYQFKNQFNEVSILEVSKLKSGFEVIYNNESNNFYNKIDGLKSIQQVKNHIKNFKI